MKKVNPKLSLSEREKKEIFNKVYENKTDFDVFRRLNDDEYFSYSGYISEEQREKAFHEMYKIHPLSKSVDEFTDFLSKTNNKSEKAKKTSSRDLFDFYLGDEKHKVDWQSLFSLGSKTSDKHKSFIFLNEAYNASFGDGQIYEIKDTSVEENFLLTLKENPSVVIFSVFFLLLSFLFLFLNILPEFKSGLYLLDFILAIAGYALVVLSVVFKLLLIDGIISKLLKTTSFLQDGIKSEIVDRRKKKFAKLLNIGSRSSFKYENRRELFDFFKIAKHYIDDLNVRLLSESEEVRQAFNEDNLSIDKDLLLYKEALLSPKKYEMKALRSATKIRNKLIKNISTEKRFGLGLSSEISSYSNEVLNVTIDEFHKNREAALDSELEDKGLALPVMFIH